jgi:SAM-dependent methyltransferase
MKQPSGRSERTTCPLCRSAAGHEFYADTRRVYLRCPICALVYVPPAYFLSSQAEKAEYDLHQNSPRDKGYRRFLGRLFRPVQARLSPASHGLDFGSGPGPTLSLMFEEAGHSMALYDPFYAPDARALERSYDFITASEVVEHLHRPQVELNRLWSCLKPGGTLGVMTKLVLDRDAFSRWHYKDDLTHVCFWSRTTFEWLAARWRTEPVFAAKDVILMDKPAS